MAFAVRHFAVLSYAQGFTLWHYHPPSDTLADVMVPGYFDDAADMMNPGDFVAVSAGEEGGVFFVVLAGGRVTLRPMATTAREVTR